MCMFTLRHALFALEGGVSTSLQNTICTFTLFVRKSQVIQLFQLSKIISMFPTLWHTSFSVIDKTKQQLNKYTSGFSARANLDLDGTCRCTVTAIGFMDISIKEFIMCIRC